jgi:thioredoxin 1
MMAVINVGSEAVFDEKILKAGLPVLVDFWASWCGPCKMATPEVEAMEEMVTGKVVVAKVNIDEIPELPSRYHVKAVPTFIVFKGGKEVSRFTGYKTRKDLLAAVENI